MPRITPVPDAEKEVGARLRELRKSQLLTGTAFALKHGITSGNLAKYENGWVPLPWSVGSTICAREGISQRWLATGQLPRTPYFVFDPSQEKLIPRRAHFSAAYRDFLAPSLHAVEASYRKTTRKNISSRKEYSAGFLGWFDGTVGSKTSLPLHQFIVECWYNNLPENERFELLRHLESSMMEYLKKKKALMHGIDISQEMGLMTHVFFERQRIHEEDATRAKAQTDQQSIIEYSIRPKHA